MRLFDKMDTIEPLTNMVTGLGNNIERISTDRNTRRQQIDMTSPFKLPHLIRPISFLVILANELILSWATIFVVFFVAKADPNAVNTLLVALASNTAILTTMVGFYYKGRKEEKISAKNAQANINIREMELEAEIYKEEILLKEEVKDNKAERKANKRPRLRRNRKE